MKNPLQGANTQMADPEAEPTIPQAAATVLLVRDSEKEGIEVLESPFKKGDAIKVIAGPFIDFTGFVEMLNEDKQKVKVMVSIFGRPTPIELDYFQVEIEK